MNLTIQVENYVSPFAAQLPKIATQDLIYVEKFEEDAYGHWVFGGDANSLVDKVNSRSLTLQAGATIQPEYGENYVRLSAAKGQSLQSGLLDSAVTDYTVSGVVMPEDVALMVLLGNLGSNDVGLGAGLFTSENKVYVTARTGVSSVDAGLALDMSKPAFISMSVNKTTGVVNIVAMQNGATFENTATGAQVEAAAPISVGNSRFTISAAYNTLKNKYYEAIIHDKALSIAEMKAMADRAKIRQANRGLTF
ncbi:hypothetical protein [Acinetobacter indicus]|uniref:hypothetical protein n=1 Tax=Acinetobacter indicus TaxID=756892 RepID=UPI000CEC77C5|nr:hypothetical protein [Acinetobacter indicus]